jgi:hypothetical protein
MGWVEREREACSCFLHPGGLIANLGVVSTTNTYGWVENHSYITNFLDLL